MDERIKQIREAAEADLVTKVCTQCHESKPVSCFGVRRLKYTYTLKSICNPCNVKISLKCDDPVRRKNNYYLREYGLTTKDVDAMRAKQNFCCAVCGIHETKATNGSLHVDHAHDTGKVRGLLCLFCNTVLGKVNDDPVILEKMIGYLKT